MSDVGDLGVVGLQCLSDLTREQATPHHLIFVHNICPNICPQYLAKIFVNNI